MKLLEGMQRRANTLVARLVCAVAFREASAPECTTLPRIVADVGP